MTPKEHYLNWAWAQRTVTPELKITLVALAFFSDDDARGIIATAVLADRTGVRPAAANASVAALEGFGLVYGHVTRDGKISYRLNVERAA